MEGEKIELEEVVGEVKYLVQEVAEKKEVTNEVTSDKKEVKKELKKAEAKPTSPSVAKGSMRKIMVVEDESDEDDDAPPAKTNTPTAPTPADSAQKNAVDAKKSPANGADAMMEAMKSMGLGGTGMPGMGMPGVPPGMGSPEDMQSAAEFAQRMAKMMQDPEIQKSLKNPRVQQVMGEMMAGGATAANAPSDDEVLKKYKDDPEVMYFYSKISSALEGVFKTPYPVDATPIPTPAPSAAKPTAAASKGKKEGKMKAEEGSKKGAGFGGLARMDASSMGQLKGNPDLQAALKDPKMLQKLHALMTNPAGAEAAISADPDLAALEDKLMAALGVNAPMQSAAAPPGPGAGDAAEKSKRGKRANVSKKMSPEERLRGSMATVQSLKAALQKHDAAVAAAKGVEDLEDLDRVREAANTTLCNEVQEELQLLQGHVEHDDDVVALLLDQGGVDTVCSLMMALPTNAHGSAGHVLSDALLVLKLVGVQERCSMGLLLHGKGRTVVKMLAWMQGVEPCSPTTVADIAMIMEIALQHDNVRRTLLKKSWSYSAKGAAGPQRVSLLAAAAAASTRPEAMQSALGCITNAAFEEHGKEQLLAHEESLLENSSASSSSAANSLLEAAVRVADSNPSGAEVGGSSAGVLRAKAMRLLLNVSASAGIRALVGKKSGLR